MEEKFSILDVNNLSKYYNNLVFSNINISLKKGEIISVFGNNGSGKSTFLNIISGIDKDYSGDINRYGDIAYIFQNYKDTLIPWKNVLENICYPLEIKGLSIVDRENKGLELLKKINIEINPLSMPNELSLGQMQIVCILRALTSNPSILILDEPFSSLDYFNRLKLLSSLDNLHKEFNFSMIFVSHNIDDILYFSNKVYMLCKDNKTFVDVLFIDTKKPRNIYDNLHDNFRLKLVNFING